MDALQELQTVSESSQWDQQDLLHNLVCWTEADRSCLVKAQQRAIKMMTGLKGTSHEEEKDVLRFPKLR